MSSDLELIDLLTESSKRDPDAPKPHCSKCGRFARYIPGSARQDWTGEYNTGWVDCRVHGAQDASWGPA